MIHINTDISLDQVLVEELPRARNLAGLRLEDVSLGHLLIMCQRHAAYSSIIRLWEIPETEHRRHGTTHYI